jgi:single-stranded-DNA-specific exonuclease
MTACLGVETSLTGRRWIGPGVEVERQAEAMAQATGLPRALCQTLARLGVPVDGAEAYLSPTLRDLLPDPRSLRDMEVAAARVLRAVTGAERIAVFADYDVDGGASAALLIDWLRRMGAGRPTLYIPDRIDEGYGPNPPAMRDLAAGHDLIICVDCGTLSFDALAAAKGADVVVLDHHLGGETLPPALAVVNPNRQDESGDLGHLCAAGVVFLMLVEAGRQLRATGRTGPDLMALLDLVALATVADVAPLVGVNRAFVRQGLRVMARRARPGLVALGDVARLDSAPAAYHLGFAPAGHRRPGRGARACPSARDAQRGAARGRGRGARRRIGAGRGAGVRRAAGLGRGRGLASGRGGDRGEPSQGGGEPPRRGDRAGGGRGQGLGSFHFGG